MKLKQNLNCKDFGIYAATCNICKQVYIDQTINSLTKWWNGHRNICKNNVVKTNHEHTDHFALVIHYKKFHRENIPKQIEEAYKVQFLKRPVRNSFKIIKFKIQKTKSKINLNNMFNQ